MTWTLFSNFNLRHNCIGWISFYPNYLGLFWVAPQHVTRGPHFVVQLVIIHIWRQMFRDYYSHRHSCAHVRRSSFHSKIYFLQQNFPIWVENRISEKETEAELDPSGRKVEIKVETTFSLLLFPLKHKPSSSSRKDTSRLTDQNQVFLIKRMQSAKSFGGHPQQLFVCRWGSQDDYGASWLIFSHAVTKFSFSGRTQRYLHLMPAFQIA